MAFRGQAHARPLQPTPQRNHRFRASLCTLPAFDPVPTRQNRQPTTPKHPPEGVEVVKLDALHEVERVLELLLRFSGEAHDDVTRDSRVGGQLENSAGG